MNYLSYLPTSDTHDDLVFSAQRIHAIPVASTLNWLKTGSSVFILLGDVHGIYATYLQATDRDDVFQNPPTGSYDGGHPRSPWWFQQMPLHPYMG